jgi:hypothetical protein
MSTQKNGKNLSIKEKMIIIDYKKQFPLAINVRIAEIFSKRFKKVINGRSIKNYIDNEEAIKIAYCINSNLISMPRTTRHVEEETRFKQWVDLVEENGGVIAELILKTKALEIYNKKLESEDYKLEEEKFTASNGWIHRFRKI